MIRGEFPLDVGISIQRDAQQKNTQLLKGVVCSILFLWLSFWLLVSIAKSNCPVSISKNKLPCCELYSHAD